MDLVRGFSNRIGFDSIPPLVERVFPIIALLGCALIVGAIIGHYSYNRVGGGLVVGGVFASAVLIWITKSVRSGMDRVFIELVALGIIAKALATLARLQISFAVYGGQDAAGYNFEGAIIGPAIRAMDWARAFQRFGSGTHFTEFLTGVVYSVIGATLLGGYLVFSAFAVIGVLLFYKAFATAIPTGRRYFYLAALLFFPSILYWPGGLGKDAPQLLFAGLFALGFAKLLKRVSPGAILLMVVGLGLLVELRPQTAAVLGVAAAIAFIFRNPGTSRSSVGVQLAIAAVLAIGAGFALSIGASHVGLSSLSASAADHYLAKQAGNVFEGAGGSSNFAAPSPHDPLWIPKAFMTVLFRPFPWEAHNFQMLLQAGENVMLLFVVAWGLPKIIRSIRSIHRQPFLLFCIIFVFIAVLGLSSLANFGLLVRERTILFPFLFALMAFKRTEDPQPAAEPSRPPMRFGTIRSRYAIHSTKSARAGS